MGNRNSSPQQQEEHQQKQKDFRPLPTGDEEALKEIVCRSHEDIQRHYLVKAHLHNYDTPSVHPVRDVIEDLVIFAYPAKKKRNDEDEDEEEDETPSAEEEEKKVEQVPEEFCAECKKLSSVRVLLGDEKKGGALHLPNAVGAHFFSRCDKLVSVDISTWTALETLPNGSFQQCHVLKDIRLPPNITSFGKMCFLECSALAEIAIPLNLTSMGQWNFKGCFSLKHLELPDSVTEIGDLFCALCDELTTFTFPSKIKTISESVLAKCEKLKTVKLPPHVEILGHSFLHDCTALESVEIPASVRQIGRQVLAGCHSLTACTFLHHHSQQQFGGDDDDAIAAAITEDDNGSTFFFNFGCSFLMNCTSLRSVTFPTLPLHIQIQLGGRCLEGCTSLTHIDFSRNTTAIDRDLCLGCNALETVELPLCASIEDCAFMDCQSLRSIKWPSSTSLGDRSRLCPSGSIRFGNHFAANCPKLSEVKLPEGLETAGLGFLKSCPSLEEIEFPSTMTYVDPMQTLSGCPSLKLIILADKMNILAPQTSPDVKFGFSRTRLMTPQEMFRALGEGVKSEDLIRRLKGDQNGDDDVNADRAD